MLRLKFFKLFCVASFICVGLLLQSWPTQANNLQKRTSSTPSATQKKPVQPSTNSPAKLPTKLPARSPAKSSSATNAASQIELSEEQNKTALKNWVFLCAPCHTVQATGTSNGPALLGEKARRRFTVVQLKRIFAAPEDHGLSEAIPAFRKLNPKQRDELALWFSKLTKPEDIVVTVNSLKPPPFTFVQNCSGCHAPDGTGGIGPNLFNVSKRRERADILKLIADPSSVGVKSNIMPTFEELSEEERVQIVDWLMVLTE